MLPAKRLGAILKPARKQIAKDAAALTGLKVMATRSIVGTSTTEEKAKSADDANFARNKAKSAEEILIEAFQSGRPIVPFLGAGVSINTGFPPIGEIAAYLAKVRHYIDFMRPIAGGGDRPKPGRQAGRLRHAG